MKEKFTYFIGIDVSKYELDYAVMHGSELLFHREAKNNPDDISAFVYELKKLPKFMISRAVFCMEHIGFYANHLLKVLKSCKASVVIENSLHIKNSLGIVRGKNDKIDAIRIARYAYINRDNLHARESKRPVIVELANLFSLRNRLLGIKISLKTPLVDHQIFVKKHLHQKVTKHCFQTLKAVESDIEKVESAIGQLIKSDERLNNLSGIVTSVPCVGRIIFIQMIISTNEFKDIKDPKKFNCYAGVAPFKNESGLTKGKARISHYANKKAKSLIHMCAIRAINLPGDLSTYYNRKVAEGKAKMSVINAVRSKIISRIFVCVRENRAYANDYSRSA